MWQKFFQFLLKRKITIGLIIIVLAIGGYYLYKSLTAVPAVSRYVIATVEKGTITTSVTGTGQISVTNQVDVKAKASGDIYKINFVKGQEVKVGQVLVSLNASDALKAVRDAEINLKSAQLSLDKLNQPTNKLTIIQAENSLAQAKESKQNAEEDLIKAYEDAFNNVANAFLVLPNIMSGLDDILFGNTYNSGQDNIDYYTDQIKIYDMMNSLKYRDSAKIAYQQARAAYDSNFNQYKITSRAASSDAIVTLLNQTYETTKNISAAIKSVNNLIQFYQDNLIKYGYTPANQSTTHLSSLNSYTGNTNTQFSTLLNALQTISNDKQAIVSAERTIVEKTLSLADINAGVDSLDLQTQQISIAQRQNALSDAREKLADYTVRAPFDGIIAATAVTKGDSISSGTVIATLITNQKVAEISLNEVDVAKIKINQKVTLTFDAVSDLTISGEVIDIDSLGTVSQGVVTYTIKIGFDTQDERIKPSMSVTASIITDLRQDVFLIPNAALKTQGTINYVQMPDEDISSNLTAATNTGITLSKSLLEQEITVGLANDAFTEVISGLKEGDFVITRIISSTTASTSVTQGQSILQNLRGGTSTGGVRIPTGGGQRD